jgi:hypothetical protein
MHKVDDAWTGIRFARAGFADGDPVGADRHGGTESCAGAR